MADTGEEGKRVRKNCFGALAIDPVDGKKRDVWISKDLASFKAKTGGTGAVLTLGNIVRTVLTSPRHIFQGLNEDADDEKKTWLCYVGLPKMSYRGWDGDVGPPYPGEVFLVFVNEDRVVYNWRWEKADEKDRSLPVNHQTRFGKKVM